MAIIKYGALATEIRGSVGGTTFQSNKYGFTVKNKAKMVLPASNGQNRTKVGVSMMSKAWASISQTGRDNWDTFAANFPQYSKKDPTAQLSGQAAFLKWHLASYLVNGVATPFDTVPGLAIPADDNPSVTIQRSGSTLLLNVTYSPNTGNWQANYFMSRIVTESQKFIGTKTRFITGGTALSGSTNITSIWTPLFGRLPVAGEIVNVGVQMYMSVGGIVKATQFFREVVI